MCCICNGPSVWQNCFQRALRSLQTGYEGQTYAKVLPSAVTLHIYEVPVIDRSSHLAGVQESFQKALRSLETGYEGWSLPRRFKLHPDPQPACRNLFTSPCAA